jgi:hypothetical protein
MTNSQFLLLGLYGESYSYFGTGKHYGYINIGRVKGKRKLKGEFISKKVIFRGLFEAEEAGFGNFRNNTVPYRGENKLIF